MWLLLLLFTWLLYSIGPSVDSLETGFHHPSDMGTLVFLRGFEIPCTELYFFYGESQAIWNYLRGEVVFLVPHVAGCLEFSFHEDFLKILGITIFK